MNGINFEGAKVGEIVSMRIGIAVLELPIKSINFEKGTLKVGDYTFRISDGRSPADYYNRIYFLDNLK